MVEDGAIRDSSRMTTPSGTSRPSKRAPRKLTAKKPDRSAPIDAWLQEL